MQLSLITTALFSFLTLTPTVLSLALQQARQASLDLPLSLCALNLESTNDHIIDAVCAGPFGGAEIEVINSKLSLDKCLTNSFGQLKVSILPFAITF
ncbi:MAG: hypothetical protein CL912_19440 [Deltaproteobacteria bacterium]|jgi:hypothetical protein|nr:hypothetical protein [Deltaproteobacteria bacterium]